ncbi:MAG: cell division protein [Micrococcales bacterium]|nr:MAG: cell division protein [Micrococcales bacterium]PIE26838.1 MAG: cell division protein [Micrococcales bacterium]
MTTVTEHTPRRRRNIEAVLLVLAVATSVVAYALTDAGSSGTWPAGLVGYGGGIAALAAVAHVALRLRAPYADPMILPIAVTLNGLGLALIHRLDLATSSGFAVRQLMWALVGMTLAVAVIWFLPDHRLLRRFTFTAMVLGFVLLLLPLLPGLGRTINGARIWIRLGPMSFQPGEIAKIMLAVFFAGYLVSQRDNLAMAGKRVLGLHLPRVRDLGPILIAWAASVGVLVMQRDLGTSLLFFGLFVAMLYVATERVSWIVIGISLFLAGGVLAYTLFSHVQARVTAWLDAMDNDVFNAERGGSYQLVQGLFGMANGGLTGTGLGQGMPHLVPYANSDFIFATLGEELGLAGVMAVLCLYMMLVERGIRTGIGVRDGFGKLLAGGLAFAIALQVFVVVGGVTRVIPVTGLTLPLLAYGGSSLLSNWIIVALLLRISDAARRPAPALSGSGAPIATDAVNVAATQHIPQVPAGVGGPNASTGEPQTSRPGSGGPT